MIPQCLPHGSHPVAKHWKAKNNRAPKNRDQPLQYSVEIKRPPSPNAQGRGERISQRQTRHETGEDQRRRPDRVAKCQAAQPQPERFEYERTNSREKENTAENRNARAGIDFTR